MKVYLVLLQQKHWFFDSGDIWIIKCTTRKKVQEQNTHSDVMFCCTDDVNAASWPAHRHTALIRMMVQWAGLYWSVPDCSCLYRTVPDCTGLYRTVLVCTGLYRTVLVCTGLYLSVPDCTGLYLSVPVCTRLYRTVPDCTCLYRSVPVHLSAVVWGSVQQLWITWAVINLPKWS